MTDKEKQAVGLSYDGQHAPKVIAKGFNELADEIIALAKAHDVLVHEDPELANFLARLEVGDEIPREVYVIIAELIAFATWLDLKA
jgi:flagellar biosynthesis protein